MSKQLQKAYGTSIPISRVKNFLEHNDHFEVVGLPVLKRYEKIGQTIVCKRVVLRTRSSRLNA